MKQINYYSTNNPKEKVNFETALLNGIASNYGLYMMDRIPKISRKRINAMKDMTYAEIAFEVLNPYLGNEIRENDLREILNKAYDEKIIRTDIEYVKGKSHIMWLTNGPTYSFKDYAARFLGLTLDHFLEKKGLKRMVSIQHCM